MSLHMQPNKEDTFYALLMFLIKKVLNGLMCSKCIKNMLPFGRAFLESELEHFNFFLGK